MKAWRYISRLFCCNKYVMPYRIRCFVLFDVTKTGVMNRFRPITTDDVLDWMHKRNTQCNFDTILQIISLRAQPEVIKEPVRIQMTSLEYDKFGFLYSQQSDQASYCWKFEFEVQHPGVFENGIVSFGALYKDCEGVPMITCNTQTESTTDFLNITDELKNIHFEEL